MAPAAFFTMLRYMVLGSSKCWATGERRATARSVWRRGAEGFLGTKRAGKAAGVG
jgi:hypothetical protein